MRRVLIFILFIVFDCQLSTVNCQQTSFIDSIIERAEYHLNIDNDFNDKQDDIVSACENYFSAIELIEQNVKRKYWNETTDSILFQSYSKLGLIYYNQTHPNIAVDVYKKSLDFVGENDSIRSLTFKYIAMAYMFISNDSALCYFNKCLETHDNYLNKIDINKVVAAILFYDYGEKDSAYAIMRKSLDMVKHDHVRDSYHAVLGEMLFDDKRYDTALYYLWKSVESKNYFVRLESAYIMSNLYDSIGDYEKKACCDAIVAELSCDRIESATYDMGIVDVYVSHIQTMDEFYGEQKKKKMTLVLIPCAVMIMSAMFFMIYRSVRHRKILTSIISDKDAVIDDMKEVIVRKDNVIRDEKFRNSIIEGKIRKKDIEIEKMMEKIKELEHELTEIESESLKEDKICDVRLYRQSDICNKIMNVAKENQRKNYDEYETTSLGKDDFILLLQSANLYTDNKIGKISEEFPRLKIEDLYYICLLILELSDRQIASLFGVTYKAVWIRRKKICSIMGVRSEELHDFLSEYL